MKIANVLPDTKKIAIDFGHDFLHIEYRPAALVSLNDEADLEDEDHNTVVRRFCDAIVTWDAEGPLPHLETQGHAIGSVVADGDPIPLEPDVIQFISIPALVGILSELGRDAMPDPKETRKQSRKRG